MLVHRSPPGVDGGEIDYFLKFALSLHDHFADPTPDFGPISANLRLMALFEAAAAAWSFSPRRASRGKRTASEVREPRRGRRLDIRIWLGCPSSESQPYIALCGAQDPLPSRFFPRLTRLGLHDRTRFVGFQRPLSVVLAPMGVPPVNTHGQDGHGTKAGSKLPALEFLHLGLANNISIDRPT